VSEAGTFAWSGSTAGKAERNRLMTMSSQPCDLRGLVALVTGAGGGANGGLGMVIARELARAGAQIAVHDFVTEVAEVTASELRQLGFVAGAFSADITDSREADRLVGQVIERFGKIDILVNNAEYRSAAYRPDQIPIEEWQRSVALNVHAPFYLSRAAVRDMRTRKFGRIVNVSNIAAIRASILHGVPYVTTKEALYGFTRHLATEVAQHGITVNAILPGFVVTPELRAQWREERFERLAPTIPARRAGTAEEIASLVVYLASREAGYLTGAAIPIDGAVSIVPGGRTDPENAFV